MLLPLLSMAQNSSIEDDSMFYEDYYVDTTATIHIGFSGGGVVQGLFYKENTAYQFNDSIIFQGSKPNAGFSLGLYLDKDINEQLWLRTGLFVSVSKLNISYDYQKQNIKYNFNHSTLEFPIWVQYAIRNKEKGLSWGLGLKASIDISRSEDVDVRLFELNSFDMAIGTGPNYRFELISGNKVDLSMSFNVGIINLITDNKSVYNQSVMFAHRWQLVFLLGFN